MAIRRLRSFAAPAARTCIRRRSSRRQKYQLSRPLSGRFRPRARVPHPACLPVRWRSRPRVRWGITRIRSCTHFSSACRRTSSVPCGARTLAGEGFCRRPMARRENPALPERSDEHRRPRRWRRPPQPQLRPSLLRVPLHLNPQPPTRPPRANHRALPTGPPLTSRARRLLPRPPARKRMQHWVSAAGRHRRWPMNRAKRSRHAIPAGRSNPLSKGNVPRRWRPSGFAYRRSSLEKEMTWLLELQESGCARWLRSRRACSAALRSRRPNTRS